MNIKELSEMLNEFTLLQSGKVIQHQEFGECVRIKLPNGNQRIMTVDDHKNRLESLGKIGV